MDFSLKDFLPGIRFNNFNEKLYMKIIDGKFELTVNIDTVSYLWKKIRFLEMIYLYSVFWWCVKFKNICWPINNSSEQNNKQTKIMGLRMPAGLHCALPKQTNQQNPQIRIEY